MKRFALIVVVLALTGGAMSGCFLFRRFLPGSTEMPKELGTARVVTGEGVLKKSLFRDVPDLGEVMDIAYRNLDHHAGIELGIAGTTGAVLLDDDSKEIMKVRFSSMTSRVQFVDVENDGITEYMTRGMSGGTLFDHEGKLLWNYPQLAPGIVVDDMAAGDLDGDGKLEFVAGFNGWGGVHLLNSAGKKLWEKPDGNVWHTEIADTDGDGKPEIIHSNAGGQLIIRDKDGNAHPVTVSGPGYTYFSGFTIVRWPPDSRKPAALLCAENQVRIFGFDGSDIARMDAPHCDFLVDPRAVVAHLNSGNDAFLAVLADYRRWDRSSIFLYDHTGKLVYDEVLDNGCQSIASVRMKGKTKDTLLVGCKGKVWAYEMPG